jgi:hypothetical protein
VTKEERLIENKINDLEDTTMADRIIEEHVVHTDGGSGGAFSALAAVLFILVLLAVLYFTGVFGRMFGPRHTDVDVNINKPGIVLQLR